VLGRQRGNQFAANNRRRASCHDQAAVAEASKSRNGALHYGIVAHVDRDNLHAAGWRHGLYDSKLAGSCGYRGIPKDGRPSYVWRNLFKQFQPFSGQTVFKHQKAGCVAARPRQALDKA
jgi:hypothetical protein